MTLRWRGAGGSEERAGRERHELVLSWDSAHELFGILTTAANSVVAPIHANAMPVILMTPDEFDLWLEGDTLDALKLQRPLPDEALRIIAKGEKKDRPHAELNRRLGSSCSQQVDIRARATPVYARAERRKAAR